MTSNNIEITAVNFKDVLAIVKRRKWLIILPLILVTIIAFAGSYLLEERFQSSTMVVIDQTQFLSKQLQAMVPGQEDRRYSSLQLKSQLIALNNEIISSAYLTRLIGELNLDDDSEVRIKAAKINSRRPDISVDRLVYYILMDELRKNIKVNFSGANIIQITVESDDPSMAMQIASRLAEIFKDERLNRELSGARGALDFSDEQLAIYKKNLTDAETSKANFQSEVLRLRLDESVTADTNVRAINADVDNIKLLIEDNRAGQLEKRRQLSGFSKTQLQIKFGTEYSKLNDDIADESERLADFMSKYSWFDPKVLSANIRIRSIQQDMETIIARVVREKFKDAPAADQDLLREYFILQAGEAVHRQKQSDLEVSLSTLRARISKQPEYEVQMRNFVNDVNSARMIYEKFRDQLTGSEISQSLMRGEAESKYRIMEPASIPIEPIKPNRLKISLLGFILGLVIGGAAAILAELLDNSFRKVEDVENLLSLPVLATIPEIPSLKKSVKVG